MCGVRSVKSFKKLIVRLFKNETKLAQYLVIQDLVFVIMNINKS